MRLQWQHTHENQRLHEGHCVVLTWLMMARWPYITHCLVAESSGNTLRSGMRAPTSAALAQRPHWVAWRQLTGVVFVPECEHKCAVGQQREAAGLLQVSGHEPWGGPRFACSSEAHQAGRAGWSWLRLHMHLQTCQPSRWLDGRVHLRWSSG